MPVNLKGRNPLRTRPAFALTQAFVRGLLRLLFGLKTIGRENVPKTGGLIFASNHKSFFDPPILGSSAPREVFFAAKKELFAMPVLGVLVKFYNSIPVRRGGYDREALSSLRDVLSAGYGVVIFPEGTRYKDDQLHPPKPGVGLLAQGSGTQIVPVFISGSHRLRRQLWRRRLRIRFGQPFQPPPPTGDDKSDSRRLADLVMKRIAELGDVPPPPPIAGG